MCDLETLKHSLVCDADLQPQHSLVCDADPQSQHSLVCDAELQLVSSSREPGQKGQKRVKGQPGLQRELGGKNFKSKNGKKSLNTHTHTRHYVSEGKKYLITRVKSVLY